LRLQQRSGESLFFYLQCVFDRLFQHSAIILDLAANRIAVVGFVVGIVFWHAPPDAPARRIVRDGPPAHWFWR
jgi:hypothetical protein